MGKNKDAKQKDEERKVGRPTKYYVEICEELVAKMTDGLSFEASCGSIGICKDTGYEWVKKYPEFAYAKNMGETMGQFFWENAGIQNLVSFGETKFNATTFIFTMKNRFGWKDKKELSGSLGVNIGLDGLYKDLSMIQIESKIADILSRLPKPKAIK